MKKAERKAKGIRGRTGRRQKEKSIEVAGKLLQVGMGRERVKAITGLTDEELHIV
ncbi:MAG: hypothetical protein AB9903_23335 [Vulcanimicrobiota bacterium]